MTDIDESDHSSEDPEHRLYQAILALKNPTEAKQFFDDLCTPAEREAMIDRWRVVAPLKKGVPYRKIHEQTGVSVTTVGRVARCISHGADGYNLIYERLQSTQK